MSVENTKELRDVFGANKTEARVLSDDELVQVSAGAARSRTYCRQCRREVHEVARERSPGVYIYLYECKNCGWEGQNPMRDD